MVLTAYRGPVIEVVAAVVPQAPLNDVMCILRRIVAEHTPALIPREGTLARDKGRCVFCDNPAKDAHHIIERRLWDDGGYYLDNGASVCREHHLACEMTTISVEDVRLACGVTKPIIPSHLYDS